MRLLSLSIFFLSFLSGCTKEEIPSEVTTLIDQIKQQYAPDKRVAHFEIKPELVEGTLHLKGSTNLPDALKTLHSKLEEKGIAFKEEIEQLPSKELQGQTFGVVRLSVANIRSKPKHSAELATQATLGTPLKVYKKEKDWYWVQTPDGYLSWLDKDGFTIMEAAAYQDWLESSKVVYLPDFGFAYQTTNRQDGIVSDLLAGNILQLIAQEGSFTKVGFPDGRTAYVATAELMTYETWMATRNPIVDNILQTAYSFLGRPYLWGGTSGKGVDCSGFTKTVFYLNGILLPRDASQQVHTGSAIATDSTLANLEAGDLLFFGRKASAEQKEKITHVAIYMGNGQIVHSAGIVKIESLKRGEPNFAEDRLKTLVRAKRPLQSIGENGILPLGSLPQYRIAEK